MADLREPFELCKVLKNGSLIGISRLGGGDNVLLTLSDRGVLVYNLQHQKLINSWSVEQRDEVTSAAVYNPVDKTFLMAVNKMEVFIWKETDSDFKSCQRIQSEKNVFALHVWSSLQNDALVIFEDGSSVFLADLLCIGEEREVKRRRITKSLYKLVWSCVFHHEEQVYSGMIWMDEKNKYTLNVTNYGMLGHINSKSKTMEFKLTPPEKDAELLSCCLHEEGCLMVSYWSSGALCLTQLEAVLEQETGDKMALSCKILQRLQPLHNEKDKDKGVVLSAIDSDHVCLCGSSMIDGKLKGVIMLWNIKYGTLQSWQTLDKIIEKQSSLLGHVRSSGACCACCIPGFICVGFHHCVAVCSCQFSMDTCSLASALGQLDSTAKFLRDEGVKPELLVTPKLARPGPALQSWSESIARDDGVEKEVLQKLIDPSKTPTLDKFSTELRNYMKLKLFKGDKKPQDSNPSSESSKNVPVPFVGKFGKKTEVLSQHFISSVLCRCTEEKNFWARDSISELVKTKCVPSSCSKDLLSCILEKNDLELLKECFENISGISEDTVVVCARHILRLDDPTLTKRSKENVTEDSQVDDVASEMPLDKTRAKYLCTILSYPVNDVFLQTSLKKLSFEDVRLLLDFLMYLMHRGLTGFADEVDCKTLKYTQVLDWAGLLLNAHYTHLVLMPDAHELLVSCHKLVAQQVRTYDKLRTLEGFLEHFEKGKPLPKAERVGPYSIETLEL